MKHSVLTLAEALTYLASIKAGTSLPLVQNKVIKSSTKYAAGYAATLGQNNGQIVLASTVPAVGLTNLPKGNMLPKGVFYLVHEVRFLFETGTGVAPEAAAWKSEAPANWKNGEFKINQNGTGNLFESSITDVTNFRASTSNDDDFRSVTPFLIRPESAYELQVALATGATANQAYKLELRVIEIVETQQN